MLEHAGFSLQTVEGRSIVRLRVQPHQADHVVEHLSPAWGACRFAPDQWLLFSDDMSASGMIEQLGTSLNDQLHAAHDLSSALCCMELSGPAARTVLAMGCGIDFHPRAFPEGCGVRTRIAQVAAIIVAGTRERFWLFHDRSFSRYLARWCIEAGSDPLTLEIAEKN